MTRGVLALDLDGTLLHSSGVCSVRTIAALKQAHAQGWTIVVVTARPHNDVVALARSWDGLRGLAVCSLGALIWDLELDEARHAFTMTAELAKSTARRLRQEISTIAFGWHDLEGVRYERHYPSTINRSTDIRVDAIESAIDRPVLQLFARDTELSGDALYARAVTALGDSVQIGYWSDNLLDFGAPHASKLGSLQRICDELGLGADSVHAFGDMPSDLAMLRWAGHGVAVVIERLIAPPLAEMCQSRGSRR